MTDNHQQFDDQLLSAYVDGELTGEQLAQVERHLETDADARQLVDELRALSQAVKSLPAEKIGEDLRSAVMQRAEREMLLGTEKSLPHAQHQPRSTRRWTWAAMAIAATLLMVAYLPTTKQVEKPLANADRIRDRAAESEAREFPRIEAVEESAVVAAGESSSTSEAAEQERIVGRGLAGEEFVAEADSESSEPSTATAFAAADDSIDLRVLTCVVDITLNDNAKARQQFDQSLNRNGIVYLNQAAGAKKEDAQTKQPPPAAERFATKVPEPVDENEAVDEPDSEADTPQFILVEAPVEQIEAVLETSNRDLSNYAEVRVTQQQASPEPSFERLRQWQRTNDQPIQDRLRSLKRKAKSALQSQQGWAQRIDAQQYQQNQLRQQNVQQKKQAARAKKIAAQDLPQVLFILRPQSTTELSDPVEALPADR